MLKIFKTIASAAILLTLVVTNSVQTARAATWSAVTVAGLGSNQQIVDIDMSGNGQVIAIAVQYNYVYVSTDGGATWVKPASLSTTARDWRAIEVSQDGTKIAAAYNGTFAPSAVDGGVWISTDSGTTWSDVSPDDGMSTYFRLTDLAMSDNGLKLIACAQVHNSANTGYIWVTTDGGASWSTGGSALKFYEGCAMSSDGSVMYASGNGQFASSGGGIFKSTDNGATWVTLRPTGTTTDNSMRRVATDATGSVVVATVYGASQRIYSSIDGGTTWVPSTSTYSVLTRAFVSRDGSVFVGVTSGGFAMSIDGANYVTTSVSGSNTYSSFAASDDMSKAWAAHTASGLFKNSSFSTDVSPPTATWTSPVTPSSTRTLSYTLAFSEYISGLTSADFSNSGTATGCTFTPSASSGSSVSVSVACTSDGTVIAQLGANAVEDTALNQGPVVATSASPVTIIADTISPNATWTEPVSPSTSRTLTYTLTFSEPVTGIVGGDFLNTGSAAGCTFSPASSSASNSVVVTVTCTSDGTVVAQLAANSVLDAASNTGPTSLLVASSVTIATPVGNSGTTTTVAPSNPVTPTQSSVVPATSVPAGVTGTTTPGQITSQSSTTLAAPLASTTSTATTTTTTTLPTVRVPTVTDDGGVVEIGGQRIEAEITRENNQLFVTAGIVRAKISAVKREGGRAPLDSNGRIRVERGDSIEIDVVGFAPSSQVEVRMYSDPVLLGRTSVNSTGSLVAAYEIPKLMTDGKHNVVLIGQSGEEENLVFALTVYVGQEQGGVSVVALLVAIPIGLAAIFGLIIPAVIRRRRKEESEN